jgi:hypothetical protein
MRLLVSPAGPKCNCLFDRGLAQQLSNVVDAAAQAKAQSVASLSPATPSSGLTYAGLRRPLTDPSVQVSCFRYAPYAPFVVTLVVAVVVVVVVVVVVFLSVFFRLRRRYRDRPVWLQLDLSPESSAGAAQGGASCRTTSGCSIFAATFGYLANGQSSFSALDTAPAKSYVTSVDLDYAVEPQHGSCVRVQTAMV